MDTTTATPTLAVTDVGTAPSTDAPALLCVPGWCGDRTVFDPLLPGLAAHRRTVTVDLPDHGESPARTEVTTADLVDDLVSTLDALGIERVVPLALSHAGWAAVALRRRLGPERVPGLVLADWMVLGTPPGFTDALAALQSPAWADVRAGLAAMWTDGLAIPALGEYVASMTGYGERHWQRAGREIAAGFAAHPVPLDAIDALQPCPTLHLFAQGEDPVAPDRPWFTAHRLDARSHFPMFEVPDEMVAAVESFVGSLP